MEKVRKKNYRSKMEKLFETYEKCSDTFCPELVIYKSDSYIKKYVRIGDRVCQSWSESGLRFCHILTHSARFCEVKYLKNSVLSLVRGVRKKKGGLSFCLRMMLRVFVSLEIESYG